MLNDLAKLVDIDSDTLSAIDKCIDLGIPFYALITRAQRLHFGASLPGMNDDAQSETFFIGEFNAPWSDNLLIPRTLSAKAVCALKPSSMPSTSEPPLPEPTDKSQYLDSVARVIADLKTRGTAKTVISMVSRRPLPEAPVSELFRRLAERSGESTAYVCYSPAIGCWMGSTPETLFETGSEGNLFSMALAGTMPCDAEVWDEKNIVEHQIVVDYIVDKLNDCGIKPIVSRRTSLPYGSIKHLYTPISGMLSLTPPSRVYDALNPTPALCGYPKDEALADIARAEMHRRDCYGGCFGLIEPTGGMEAFVNIRCCRIADGYAYCYGGGGITPDSVPVAEWDEANTKIDNLMSKLRP